MRILSVSTSEHGGGAEKVARDLVQGFQSHGHDAWLAVGRRQSADSSVILIPQERDYKPRNPLAPPSLSVDEIGAAAGRGEEDVYFPGTWDLLDLPPARPDIVHCHNLHGWYFDLRVLPWLSHAAPTVLTLHDAWTLSGHCAHSLSCERWRHGCDACPDLGLYPALQTDGAGDNWRRKRDIYRRSRLFVTAPSRWLMDRAHAGILQEGIVESTVIPNGVDTETFIPGDKLTARRTLGIADDAVMLLFAANGIRNNPWKDYPGLRTVLGRLGARLSDRRLLLVGLGDSGPPEQIGSAQIVFHPFERNPARLAVFYQAADVYLHMARAESFGLVIAEAMSCGVPVAATAVGGIPELLRSFRSFGDDGVPAHGRDRATGLLTRAGDIDDLVDGLTVLLNDATLCARLGENAQREARARFDVRRVVSRYLEWFSEAVLPRVVEGRRAAPRTAAARDAGAWVGELTRALPEGRPPVVLMYHRVVETQTDPQVLAVRPSRFAEHLEAIRRVGRPMSLRRFVEALRTGAAPPDAIVVTFDDGYADNLLNAKPILEALEVPATVFVTTGPLDEPGHEPWWDVLERVLLLPGHLPDAMTLATVQGRQTFQLGAASRYGEEEARRLAGWSVLSRDTPTPRHHLYRFLHKVLLNLRDDTARRAAIAHIRRWANDEADCRPRHRFMTRAEVAQLAEGGLVEVGAHTVTHPILARLPADVQRTEILESRQVLETIIGRPPLLFAYPYGFIGSFNTDTVDILRQGEFLGAVTTVQSPTRRGADPFQIPRMVVRDWPGAVFEANLTAFIASATLR
ncbi:MAG: polysaccharide deacetylase family protein [Planctomycetia bacterium]